MRKAQSRASRKEITDKLEVDSGPWRIRRVDGSSSEGWLHKREEGGARRAKSLGWGLVVSIPGRNGDIEQEREAAASSGPIGFGVIMSHPHGGDGIIGY